MLAAAALIALTVEVIGVRPGPTREAAALSPPDIDEFLAPLQQGRPAGGFAAGAVSDPLAPGGTRRAVGDAVAPGSGVPTVSSSGRAGRRLTAILIVDDRPVAVLDDIVVGIGDRLADGARVAGIRADRVEVVEKNGQRRVLTLMAGRQ